jgi:mono/diheme cytochrome c family protein
VSNTDFNGETDFRDLVRHPQKLFGYSYFYFLAVMLLLGMLYVWNLTVIGKNAVAPTALGDSTAFVLDIPWESPVTLPPVDVMKMGVPSESLVERGRELYRANCSSCHGDNGMGDGPSAATMNPKPRNFHSLQGWTNGSKVSQIYKTLQEGIIKNGMASYNFMPPADRFALIHYVRTFAQGQPVDTPEELQQLETTYQLSKGTSAPGQIPIKRATELVLAESAPKAGKISALAAEALADTDNPGAKILQRVARDVPTVLTSLVARREGIPTEEDFVRMALGESRGMGFRTSVALLSAEDWSEMYGYVRRLVERKAF